MSHPSPAPDAPAASLPIAPPAAGLPGWLASVLVAGTSAAVLVLEILAGRLLAPYVGVSLETYTGVIGVILLGIAAGAAAGGVLADRFEVRRLLPLLLVAGGVATVGTIPLVRVVGRWVGQGGGASEILLLTSVGFLPVAVVLSAVPPTVVKLQLRDLRTSGATVGRLSAIGTGGAIAGTFLTGFVLVRWAAVTTLVVAVGVLLVLGGLGLEVALRRDSRRRTGLRVAAALAATSLPLIAVPLTDAPCDAQTRYYCLRIVTDPDHPSGRTLFVDDLQHSYVDLDDPTRLRYWYARRTMDAVNELAGNGPLDVTYVGGGGLTLPRYLGATRPGSTHTVLELDPDLLAVVEARLGLPADGLLDVRIGDARLRLAELPDDSADVVVGDAFGGRAVPWHLTTSEFIEEIDRVLRPGGIYVLNVLETSGRRFLGAETRTIASVLPHVAVFVGPRTGPAGQGNAVVVAAHRPIDAETLDARRRLAGDAGELVVDLETFLRDAPLLTDDFAPVDQLLGRTT